MSYQLIVSIIIVIFCRSIETSNDEHRLVDYLFSEQGYNPLVRPTEHSNQTVVVAFGLLLVQLIHVGEESAFFIAERKIVGCVCRFMRKSK